MPDMTKCRGDGCPVRESCYRYTAPPSDMQSYFQSTPGEYGEVEDGLFGKQAEWLCAYRWEIKETEWSD